MPVDISDILHVLAHELRTPVGIAHGYIRLLLEDRLPQETDRRRALEQIQRALARLSSLTQESSALASRSERNPTTHEPVSARSVLDQVAAADYEWPVTVDTMHIADSTMIRTTDAAGLVEAIVTLVRATAREVRGGMCALSARVDERHRLEVLVAPPELLTELRRGPEAHDAAPVALERGGLGLTLVQAAIVLDEHGAERWTMNGSRQTVGFRLSLEERP